MTAPIPRSNKSCASLEVSRSRYHPCEGQNAIDRFVYRARVAEVKGTLEGCVIMRLLNIIGHKRGFIIDEPPRRENSGSQVMERFSPPAASLKKRISPPIAWNLGLTSKEPRIIRVILLGHQGVGKTALAVRFATKRFIGEYDGSTERIYKVDSFLDATWELTDPPGFLPPPTEFKLRWADAIILVYSVSDRVSFDETSRLRFLVSRAKNTRKVPPVVMLIANKSDLSYTPGERVVSPSEGRQRAEEIEAHAFHEISVRESVEQVMAVFTDIFKLLTELPGNSGQQASSFRVRASTDSTLNALRRPSPVPLKRRFSISVRGTMH